MVCKSTPYIGHWKARFSPSCGLKKRDFSLRGFTDYLVINRYRECEKLASQYLSYRQVKLNFVVYYMILWGPGVAIPGGVTGFFSDIFPSDKTMALGSTQPVVKMSTRNIPGGKGGRCVRLTTKHHTVPVMGELYLYLTYMIL